MASILIELDFLPRQFYAAQIKILGDGNCAIKLDILNIQQLETVAKKTEFTHTIFRKISNLPEIRQHKKGIKNVVFRLITSEICCMLTSTRISANIM